MVAPLLLIVEVSARLAPPVGLDHDALGVDDGLRHAKLLNELADQAHSTRSRRARGQFVFDAGAHQRL